MSQPALAKRSTRAGDPQDASTVDPTGAGRHDADEREAFATALEQIIGSRPDPDAFRCGYLDRVFAGGTYRHRAVGTTFYMRPRSARAHVYVRGIISSAPVTCPEEISTARSSVRSSDMVLLFPVAIVTLMFVAAIASTFV